MRAVRHRALLAFIGVAIALITTCAATATTAAAAGVTPYTFQVPDSADFDADGTDVYWLERELRRDRKRDRLYFETRMMRGSLIDKSVKQLGAYDEDRQEYPVSILANAGFVYVNFSNLDLETEGPIDAASKVVRMSREGTDAVTLAKSTQNLGRNPAVVFENGVGRLNDCGTSVSATSVSFTGDVVISQLNSERESKRCGRKQNFDLWTYYELTPAGVRREITSEGSRVKRKIKRRGDDYSASWGPVSPPVAEPWVYYGKAVFQKNKGNDFYVLDLATRATTGPFTIKSPGRDFFAWGAVNSVGQLAVGAESTTGKGKREKTHQKAGVFRAPGDPNSYVQHKGSSGMQFCGDHLIVNNSRGLTEIDPNNFWLQRVVAGKEAARGLSLIEPACSDRFVYVTRYTSNKTALLAYPLD